MKRATVRLAVYRPPPEDIQYSHVEHAAVCRWCYWNQTGTAMCQEPSLCHGSERTWEYTYKLNPHGRCSRYMPTALTSILQWLRIRPWVPMPTDPQEPRP